MSTKEAVCVDYTNKVLFEKETEFPSSFTINSDLSQAVISADLSQVAGAFGDKITVIDVKSQKAGPPIQAPGSVNDVSISAAGVCAVTNRDLLFLQTAAGNKEVKLPEEGTAVAYAGAFVFVGTKRGGLLKADPASGKVQPVAQVGSGKITRLVLGQLGNLLAVGCSNGLLAVYSLAEDKLLADDLKYHNMPITAISFYDEDRKCLTAAHERDVHAWDLTTFQHTAVYEHVHRFAVLALAPAPQGFVSAGHDGSLKRWSINN